MGRMQIVLPDDLEQKLREKALKKGDISKIIERGVRKELEEMEQK